MRPVAGHFAKIFGVFTKYRRRRSSDQNLSPAGVPARPGLRKLRTATTALKGKRATQDDAAVATASAPPLDGRVATYVPEPARANLDDFGICIVTADGHAYAVGDSDRPRTIPSISKPIVYAATLADRGRARVLAKVGVEPSGEAFNSISLDPQTGAPLNPVINAGAIAWTGLLNGDPAEEQWARFAGVIADFALRSRCPPTKERPGANLKLPSSKVVRTSRAS